MNHIEQIPEPPGEKEEGEPDWHAVRVDAIADAQAPFWCHVRDALRGASGRGR